MGTFSIRLDDYAGLKSGLKAWGLDLLQNFVLTDLPIFRNIRFFQ